MGITLALRDKIVESATACNPASFTYEIIDQAVANQFSATQNTGVVCTGDGFTATAGIYCVYFKISDAMDTESYAIVELNISVAQQDALNGYIIEDTDPKDDIISEAALQDTSVHYKAALTPGVW